MGRMGCIPILPINLTWCERAFFAKSLSIQQHYEPCQQYLNKQCIRKHAVLLMLDVHKHRSECFPDNFTWQAD